YELLSEAQPVQTGDQIEVVEMFWYKCPHCYHLEPYIERWLQSKPDNAQFVPIPAVLGKNWAFGARAYYALEALGLDQQLHAEVFKAIHEQRKSLDTVETFVDWAAAHPAVKDVVDRELLLAAFDSFAVENKVNFATLMAQNYRITGVPAIIVDGKYRTSVTLAGSPDKLIEVINHLVALAAEERS
ncbi:MAG: thiol:disulfide interchange protein DsbA/DsbL, partial [bacterium]